MSTTAADKKTETPKVTEQELRKSLDQLAGGTAAAEPEKVAEPKLEKVILLKSLDESIKEKGSENLRKAIDASDVLKDLGEVLGLHVDGALEEMKKSLEEQAQRDHSTFKVLERLAKALEDNTAAVKAFGEKPAAPAGTKAATSEQVTVLEKTAGAGATKGNGADDKPKATKRDILRGLEALFKSAESGSMEQNRWLSVAAKFEATGKIDDSDLTQAATAAGVMQGPKK